MLGRLYESEICSAARTLEVAGERWSLLIVRNAVFAGMTRFTDFQRSLGIAPNVLTKRLNEFVAEGVFELRVDPASGKDEYVITQKGLDLKPVIVALTEWGDKWVADSRGKPISYVHDGCTGTVSLVPTCTKCGSHPTNRQLRARLARWFQDLRNGGAATKA
jgi:DNA-binding HxlR family transcriptional regulator